MANELQSIQLLISVSNAIIKTPSLSVRDFGIKRQTSDSLIWSGAVSTAAVEAHASLAGMLASSSIVGAGVVMTTSALRNIGLTALAGVGAAALGASFIPVVGWAASATIIASYGIGRYRKAKEQEAEKERMYREIIAKQQVAIKRQKDINSELEVLLRNEKTKNAKNSERIKDLEQQVANLQEMIEILMMQNSNFKAA